MNQKTLAVAAVFSALTFTASAIPITGSISMSTTPGSSWTGDGGNVNTIASILDFGASSVDDATGDFIGTIGGAVAWGQPLSFAAPATHNPLWTIGGFAFNIDAAPLSVERFDHPFPQPDVLSVAGRGTVTAPGFDATVGGWAWSGTMNGKSTFSFQSATTTAVPDSGSTMALCALAGAAFFAFRKL
jgi:hypothetical protein